MSADQRQDIARERAREQGPKISRGEELLYGDFAEVVRRIGTATVELHEAMIRLGASINECEKIGQTEGPEPRPMDPFEDTVRTAFARLAPIHDALIDEQAYLVATAVNVTARSRALPDPETGRFTFPDSQSSEDPVPGQIYGDPGPVGLRVTSSSSPVWTEVPTGSASPGPQKYPDGVVPGAQGFPSRTPPTEAALIDALNAMEFWQDRRGGWQVACGADAELALRRIIVGTGHAGPTGADVLGDLVIVPTPEYAPNEWMVIRPAGAGG